MGILRPASIAVYFLTTLVHLELSDRRWLFRTIDDTMHGETLALSLSSAMLLCLFVYSLVPPRWPNISYRMQVHIHQLSKTLSIYITHKYCFIVIDVMLI